MNIDKAAFKEKVRIEGYRASFTDRNGKLYVKLKFKPHKRFVIPEGFTGGNWYKPRLEFVRETFPDAICTSGCFSETTYRINP